MLFFAERHELLHQKPMSRANAIMTWMYEKQGKHQCNDCFSCAMCFSWNFMNTYVEEGAHTKMSGQLQIHNWYTKNTDKKTYLLTVRVVVSAASTSVFSLQSSPSAYARYVNRQDFRPRIPWRDNTVIVYISLGEGCKNLRLFGPNRKQWGQRVIDRMMGALQKSHITYTPFAEA